MDKALYERDRSDQEMIVLKDPPLGGHLPFSVKQLMWCAVNVHCIVASLHQNGSGILTSARFVSM